MLLYIQRKYIIGENNQGYHDIGDPAWKCAHCDAKFWYDERIEKSQNLSGPPKFNLCCVHG